MIRRSGACVRSTAQSLRPGGFHGDSRRDSYYYVSGRSVWSDDFQKTLQPAFVVAREGDVPSAEVDDVPSKGDWLKMAYVGVDEWRRSHGLPFLNPYRTGSR